VFAGRVVALQLRRCRIRIEKLRSSLFDQFEHIADACSASRLQRMQPWLIDRLSPCAGGDADGVVRVNMEPHSNRRCPGRRVGRTAHHETYPFERGRPIGPIAVATI